MGAILDEVLTGTLPAFLTARRASPSAAHRAVCTRLRALSSLAAERAAGALTASLFSLGSRQRRRRRGRCPPAPGMAPRHGDLQAAHVFADARGRCWLLTAHRAGPAHALSDVS